jgi:hypothetical protein
MSTGSRRNMISTMATSLRESCKQQKHKKKLHNHPITHPHPPGDAEGVADVGGAI